MTAPRAHDRAVVLDRDGVLWRQLDDEILVLDVAGSRYLRLNHTGTVLWKALEDPRRPDELVALLTSTYDVPPERALSDVGDFLAALRSKGLVRELP